MYKLLVVDDEFNIRDGIINAIPWDKIGAEVVGEALDGQEALEKVEMLSPDIVITDVYMDYMDGLELSDVLHQKYPLIKVIILSGYDDFEFVKKALALKVFTYIIKPVFPKELIEIVANVIAELEKEKQFMAKIQFMESEISRNKSLLLERFLYDMINGNIQNNEEMQMRMDFLDIHFRKKYYSCLLVTIPEHYHSIKGSDMKRLHSLMFSIREIFLNTMDDYEIWSLTSEYGKLTLIAGINSPDEDEYSLHITKKLEQAIDHVTRLLDISVFITVGGTYSNLMDLSKSFREMTIALEHNSITCKSNMIHISDIPSSNGVLYVYPIEKENMLLRSLTNLDEKKSEAIIKSLFDDMEQQSYTKDRMRIDIMGLMGMVSRKAIDMGVDMYHLYGNALLNPFMAFERYHTREQIENWVRNIFIKTIHEIRSQKTSDVKSVIKKANEFLNECYIDPDLSLATISDHVFLSPSYFSRLFKKETGESYVEALTKIRLNMAKTLLMESNKKIMDISEKVGYSDSKYFCTIFKKYFGYTPIEFREMQSRLK
jgi:two-component system, response regulator YesN